MLKKIAIMALLAVSCSLLAVSCQAETIVYAGGQMLVKGGSTDGIGGGTVLAVGQKISDRMILWGSADMFKTNEGISVDNGFAGFSFLTEELISELNSGLFITVEGGFGKVEKEKVRLAKLANAGFYFDLSKTTRLWLGGGYSDTDKVDVYSAEVGLSMKLNWK